MNKKGQSIQKTISLSNTLPFTSREATQSLPLASSHEITALSSNKLGCGSPTVESRRISRTQEKRAEHLKDFSLSNTLPFYQSRSDTQSLPLASSNEITALSSNKLGYGSPTVESRRISRTQEKRAEHLKDFSLSNTLPFYQSRSDRELAFSKLARVHGAGL